MFSFRYSLGVCSGVDSNCGSEMSLSLLLSLVRFGDCRSSSTSTSMFISTSASWSTSISSLFRLAPRVLRVEGATETVDARLVVFLV